MQSYAEYTKAKGGEVSELAPGQTVKYRIFKAKITKCSSDAPLCWYKERIGETFTVQERQYYQKGKPDGSSYWTSSGPKMGFNANIEKDDLEEL